MEAHDLSPALPRQAKRRQAGRRAQSPAPPATRRARFARAPHREGRRGLASGRPGARRCAPDGQAGGTGPAPPAQSQAELRPSQHRRRRSSCCRGHARRIPRHPRHALRALYHLLHAGQSPSCQRRRRRRRRRRRAALLRPPNARGGGRRRLLAALFRPQLPREIAPRCLGRSRGRPLGVTAGKHAAQQPLRFAALRRPPLAAVFRPRVAVLRRRRLARPTLAVAEAVAVGLAPTPSEP